MDQYKWGVPSILPDGHRQFPLSNDKVAVADDSGREPQDCTDGVLWYDFNRPLIITRDKSFDPPREHFGIPLTTEAGEHTRTVTNAATILLLSSEHGWDINVHGVLFRAHQK